MRRRQITVRSLGGGMYCVAGDVLIAETASPIRDAAISLLEQGCAPSDTLDVDARSADFDFVPMPIGRIALWAPTLSNRRALNRDFWEARRGARFANS